MGMGVVDEKNPPKLFSLGENVDSSLPPFQSALWSRQHALQTTQASKNNAGFRLP